MKRSVAYASLLAVSGILTTFNAIAEPNIIEIGILCPDASGTGNNTLSNWGSGLIAGYGKESINSAPSPQAPYFSVRVVGANFPSRISDGNYASTGTQYDPTQATVTCSYASSSGFDPINVNYALTNGVGGVIIYNTVNTIVLNQYVGLKK